MNQRMSGMWLLKSWSRVTELEWMYSQRRCTIVWTINRPEWGSRLTALWNYCEANKWTGRVQWLHCVHWEPTRTFGTIVKQTSELEEYSDYIVSTENQPALLELLWSKQANWKSTVTTLCPLRTNPHFWNFCEANKWTGRVQWIILWRGTPHPDWLQSIKRPSGCYLRGCYLRTSANGKGRAWEDGNTGTKKAKTHTELVNFVVLVEKADRRPCFFLEQGCNKMSSTSEQLPLESHASSLDVSGYSEN